ncbi:NUDIX hydrolase [Actinomadura craniellae]|uniref:NUDIX hydrolase n=1 Tax=Actinomadura craniellae TaxID=2231787 RepID=A0A365HDS1_9ACTN|nr:nucleoside 2-deoxyribosyltransferase domain-containing protein [Actinomadura craniellae]RAY16403.1 NUDIX hydrolase [Actinomadura craniellae]
MGGEVTVVYALEEPPGEWDAAVFLAGPTPRSPDVLSWRPEMIGELRRRWPGPGRLVVFSPEHWDGLHDDYTGQVGWEERCLNLADEVIFWVPRDLVTLPAFTTNVEWGMWHDSGRAVFGAPPDAPKNRYLLHYAGVSGVPTATTPGDAAAAALRRIGAGARRAAGEREVPLLVWRTASFQAWYAAQRGAGNALRAARLEWAAPANRLWLLRAHVHVAAEDRVKDNEVVLLRPDVSVVVLYRPGVTPADTEVVLVREFRTPGATADGFVHELPGGSGPGDPPAVAVAEVAEETGLRITPDRLRAHGSRQVAATLSSYRAHLFSAELTAGELAVLRAGGPHGTAADGERTYPEVATYGEIVHARLVDWSTLGMLAEAFFADRPRIPETGR